MHFDGAHFAGDVYFAGDAYFDRVTTFTGDADFDGAHFAGDVYFAGDAYFDRVTTFTRDAYAHFVMAEFRASAAFSGIQGQPSFGFEECKFNKRSRGTYEWGPIPIPEDNDGLPAGAVWEDFQEEDDKDGGTTTR